MKMRGINSVTDPEFYEFKEEINQAFSNAWLDFRLSDEQLFTMAANREIEYLVPPLEIKLYDDVFRIVDKYF